MSYALKGRIRWLNPLNFCCSFYVPRVHWQPSKGWDMQKSKKSKNHCNLMYTDVNMDPDRNIKRFGDRILDIGKV